MSTATAVPSTAGLEGDEAFETLRQCGRRRLALDAFDRFRAADGFSHSRALAFQIALTIPPALVAVVGLASMAGQNAFTQLVRDVLDLLAPGAAHDLLTQALDQGAENVREERGERAAAVGVTAALIAGTTAFGQLERGANRIYGVERDRPPLRKYGTAALLCCTAGAAITGALVVLVGGGALRQALDWGETLDTVWRIARWPIGVGLFVTALALLFEVAPRRRQPEASWLVVGSGMAAMMWLAGTAVLALLIDASEDFGATYGELAGTLGILMWAFLTSVSILLGLSFAAQLEAVRAGVPGPRVMRDENVAG